MSDSNIPTSKSTTITMDNVPEFAAHLHCPDPTYGILNEVNHIENYALYVRYPGKYWGRFTKNESNAHQLNALKEFIASGEQTKTITVHHSCGGMFVATFTRSDGFDKNYNKIWSYKREDGNSVHFMVSYGSQIGFINRVSCEPVE